MSESAVIAASPPLTDSRLASLCAKTAERAFLDYQQRFDAVTRRARARFLTRDLSGNYADAAERLHLYGSVMDGLTSEIEPLMGPRLQERTNWTAINAV